MPDLSSLYPKPGGLIRYTWGLSVVKWLENSMNYGAVTYSGYVRKDLIPVQDLALNLGSEDFKFNNIYVGNVNADLGYFNDNAFIQGKRVLKDGDPIYIADLFAKAEERIKDAVLNALSEAHIPPKPYKIGSVFNKYVYPLTDIFPTDIDVPYSGKVRIKLLANVDEYAYLKWQPYGEPYPITGLLADTLLNANVFHELESTVNKFDKVNVKVSKAGKVTIYVYNIPEG